jgi:hypothetical protein
VAGQWSWGIGTRVGGRSAGALGRIVGEARYLETWQAGSWAVTHMRLDLINADVLGPPGLNGSSRFVETERVKGVVEQRFPPTSKVVAAGVLAVSKDLQLKYPGAGLTVYCAESGRLWPNSTHASKRLNKSPLCKPFSRRKAGAEAARLDSGNRG